MNGRKAVRFTAVMLGAVILATIVPIAVPVAAAGAAPFAVSQARLLDTDGAFYPDHFAGSVAVAGDLAVVGRPGYESDRGAVYVYKRTGTSWAFVHRINGAAVGDKFGYSVAMDGNRLVVGAPYADTGKGADAGTATVYTWSGASFGSAYLLSGETIIADEHFGWSVDISGDYLVVGAPDDDTNEGSAWPYHWESPSWVTQGTLSGMAGDYLGRSVAVANDTVLAGAPGRNTDTGVVDAGCVYVYTRSGAAWSFTTRLYAPDPQTSVGFGAPVAIDDSGYVAIVGSPWWKAASDTSEQHSGRAYIYTRGVGWNPVPVTLANPGPVSASGDHFGSSVTIDSSNLAFVGAYWDDNWTGAGYYYQYRSGAWSMVQKVTPGAVSPGVSLFGAAAAMDNGTLIVGAPTSGSVDAFTAGSAFIYNSRATITGICRDAITGLPVAGAEVTAYVMDAWGEPQMANANSLMITGADGRYTLSVDSGQIYLGYMGMIPYQPGWYNDVPLSSQATPITVWAGNTYTYNLNLYPIGAVFRFYNAGNGTHFYTDSIAEMKHVKATWPHIFTYEGVAYRTDPTTETQALYRFYNQVSRSHFYTASLTEANHIKATWPHIFTYDGPTYKVSPVPMGGKIPVYRFFNRNNGSHFFTASAAESNYVKASLAHVYTYEGPAFWIGNPGPF